MSNQEADKKNPSISSEKEPLITPDTLNLRDLGDPENKEKIITLVKQLINERLHELEVAFIAEKHPQIVEEELQRFHFFTSFDNYLALMNRLSGSKPNTTADTITEFATKIARLCTSLGFAGKARVAKDSSAKYTYYVFVNNFLPQAKKAYVFLHEVTHIVEDITEAILGEVEQLEEDPLLLIKIAEKKQIVKQENEASAKATKTELWLGTRLIIAQLVVITSTTIVEFLTQSDLRLIRILASLLALSVLRTGNKSYRHDPQEHRAHENAKRIQGDFHPLFNKLRRFLKADK